MMMSRRRRVPRRMPRMELREIMKMQLREMMRMQLVRRMMAMTMLMRVVMARSDS